MEISQTATWAAASGKQTRRQLPALPQRRVE